MYERDPVPVDPRRKIHQLWTVSARLDHDVLQALQAIEKRWPNNSRSDVIRSAILTLHKAIGLSDE